MKPRYWGFALTTLLIVLALEALCVSGGCDHGRATGPADGEEGLVAYWDFHESGGAAVHDVSGNGFHGTNYGGDWVSNASLCGRALDIMEEGDGVWGIPANWDDGIGNALTVSARVIWRGPAPEDQARACIIFDGRSAGHLNRYGMVLSIRPSGQVFFQLQRGVEIDNVTLRSNFTMPVRNATHLAVVLNQPEGWLRLYVNGQLDTSVAAAGGYIQSDLSAALGNSRWAREDHLWSQLHGVVADLRIYNRALSEEEISELSGTCADSR